MDEIQHKYILDSISDGVFTVDLDFKVTSFNRAAEQITGISRSEAIGRRCEEVFRSNMCHDSCPLSTTIKTGKVIIGRTGYIINSQGDQIPISVSTAVLKDFQGRLIGGAETFRDLSEVEFLRHELKSRYRLNNIVSKSEAMQRIFQLLPTIAIYDTTVLITGETGTGKELIARTIHELSSRSKGPFLAVNCGAIPEPLMESELFGYKRGAFTGALKDKPGLFAQARGGTIFLDEIGEMGIALQVKLLRVLEDKSFQPLGSQKSETTDARIIVATNKDLKKLVAEGRFREDLYYRINVVRLELPPLRERKEDIPLLVEYFLTQLSKLHGKPVTGITTEALALLMSYNWPGNVRELANTLESALIICDEALIGIQHLPKELVIASNIIGSKGIRYARNLVESEIIIETLKATNWNKAKAAQRLGIHKTTLFRTIKKLGIMDPKKSS